MSADNIIIIGAGVAGMTAAIHLAKKGLRVRIIEKNKRPGGRCDRFERQGHHFDTGPTLLVMPQIFQAEFEALGLDMQSSLELQRVDPSYHLVFDDGSQLALSADEQLMHCQLEAIEPGSYQAMQDYLDEGRRHYDLAVERLVNRDFRSPSDFFNLKNLPLLLRLKVLVPHYRNMSAYFDEARLKAAFTFQDVYMGLSPFEAPATFSMMPYTEMAHGVWYPRGGMYRVVETLRELALRMGVEFEFGARVERIEIEDERARAILLQGERLLQADAFVANADLPYVFDRLLPDANLGKKMARKRFSCSVISFFWGVDRIYSQLQAHNLFLADDYRRNFDQIIRDLSLPDNPSLYVHAPARLDPDMAPPGEDTLTAIVPVGHLDENGAQDWGKIRDRARQEVFRRLELLGVHDLQEHIKFEINFTPPSWRKRYSLMKGATHGLCHNLAQLGYMRPANRHPIYRNLYFAGASTRPGTGLPTAMVSGRLAAERLCDEIGVPV